MRSCWFLLFCLPLMLWGQRPEGADTTAFDPALAPFYHGVASGDPLSDRVIIWTRVTPDDITEPVKVNWFIGTDTAVTNLVRNGSVTTDASRDFTVKVDVDGLQSNTTYYYVFEVGGRYSLTGRTRTAPLGAEVDHLRFAIVSCSNYEAGYFNAYGRIADRADLDAVVHLGDYIYEYPGGTYGDSTLQRRHDSVETITLPQYRNRYSQYRLDPDLRRAHQQHPFICIWDDHESANDAWKDGAQNHDPATEGAWTLRKSLAKQAYFEWLPIRDQADTSIYRTLPYGDLATWIMLDTRLEAREQQIRDVTNPALYAEARTLLGPLQRDWLLNELGSQTATWKLIGNQVMFSPLQVGWAAEADPTRTPEDFESIFLDIWDGYPAERSRLIHWLDSTQTDNVVFLTGDFHSSFAFEVNDTVTDAANDYLPIPQYDPATGAGAKAVEFVTPSITSANFDENIGAQFAAFLEAAMNQPLFGSTDQNPNPHMKYVDLDRHGYLLLDVQPDTVQANFYYVARLDTPTTAEAFGTGLFTQSGSNHLQTTAQASTPKTTAPALAPAQPKASTTGLAKEVPGLALLGLYPQPAEGLVQLQFALNQPDSIQLLLQDLSGRTVHQWPASYLLPGLQHLRLDLPELPAGTYLLRLQGQTVAISRKLALQ